MTSRFIITLGSDLDHHTPFAALAAGVRNLKQDAKNCTPTVRSPWPCRLQKGPKHGTSPRKNAGSSFRSGRHSMARPSRHPNRRHHKLDDARQQGSNALVRDITRAEGPRSGSWAEGPLESLAISRWNPAQLTTIGTRPWPQLSAGPGLAGRRRRPLVVLRPAYLALVAHARPPAVERYYFYGYGQFRASWTCFENALKCAADNDQAMPITSSP